MINHSRRRTLGMLGTVAVLSLTLTACQGIPTSGGVHQGLSQLTQTEQEVQYRPDMPMPDATQEEIVRGFLQAASSASDDYRIAREFLSREYQAQWDPSLSVTIDEGARIYSSGEENAATLQVGGIASIDEQGVLTQLDVNETTQFQFELTQEQGEWRITSAPNGVILDRSTFQDVWSDHQLYFSGARGALVSDTRWFLNRATMGTHIVNQLLAGPTEQLTGVAVSSFPTGTRLASEAVIIDGGTAQIDLSPEFESISEEAYQQVEVQLAASLYSVPGVSSFVVTVGGVELLSGAVAYAGTFAPPITDGGSSAAILTDGKFGFLNTTGFSEEQVFSQAFATLSPSRIVLTRDETAAITLSEQGLHWVSASGTFLFDDRKTLIEPTVDAFDYVWILARNVPEAITVWHPTLSSLTIETPALKGESVTAMRVSPDGNRIAFLLDDGATSRILITGIVRDDNGVPQRLINLEAPSESWVQGAAIDLDWIDSQRVAVLTQGDSGSTRFTTTGPGQFSEARAGVQGAVALRGGGRFAQTYLLSKTGDVSTPQGTSGWQRQMQNVDVLAKRG